MAQQTSAYQSTHSLLLSDKARADALPILEIEADDVRCKHGSTTGMVDDEQIFYLMSRGLSRQEAQRMIVQGFFETVITEFPVEGVQEKFVWRLKAASEARGGRAYGRSTSIPKCSSVPTGSQSTRTTPTVRIVESDEDVLLYEVGHVPGAIKVDWHSELQHQVVRDYIDKEAFAKLVGSKGIGNNHTIVFYGDRNNWWACYALWVFKMYGHQDCRIMNGGRQKWIDEGRTLTQERPNYPAVTYAGQRS